MNDPLPALRALAGGARSASDIKAAEASLLAAEDADPDRCARSLLTVALCPTAAAPAERLAALLALRAIAGRRWSDRGRGPLPTSRPGGRPARRLLADDAKGLVRRAVLSAVVGEDVGPAEGGATAAAATTAFPFAQAARGLDGEREDGGDGAGPLGRAASALLAALGRRDPPARFAALAPALVRAAASEGGRRDAALRSLFALDEVVESLCEKRLLADRRHVGQIAVASLPSLVGAVYLPAVEAALGGGGGEADGGGGNADAAGTVHASRTAALALSVLRRLLARSLPEALRDPAAAATADRLLEAALRSLPPLVAAAMGGGALPPPLPLRDLLGATCALPVEVQKSHPVEFAARGYLGPYCAWFGDVLQSLPQEGGEDAAAIVTGADGSGDLDDDNLAEDAPRERLVRDAMTFLANVFANKMYDASDPEADRAAAAIASSAFPPARRVELALAAVRSHLPLSPPRLGRWRDDPEGHFHAEAARASDEDRAAAALALYLSVAEGASAEGRAAALPRVAAALRDVSGQGDAIAWEARGDGSLQGAAAVLWWDALYTAAGTSVGALETGSDFRFGAYVEEFLLPGLEALILEAPSAVGSAVPPLDRLPVLRHRILWLLASNTCGVPHTCRARMYSALLALIVDERRCLQNDIRVKLTAVQVVNNSLFDRDESLAIFRDHSDTVIAALYRLAGECTEYESRSLLLTCVSLILTYLVGCGTITPETANTAVGPLTQIWSNAVEQNALLKKDVLAILSSLVQAVGSGASAQLHPVAVPMIDTALDPALSEQNLFLVEEALGLWLAIVRLAPAYTDVLGSLFFRATHLLAQDLDHLKVLMLITEGYILLGCSPFLCSHSVTLQHVLVSVVGKVRPRGTACIMVVLEALLRGYPTEGGQLLKQAGVLRTMLEACAATHAEVDGNDPDRVITLYLTTLARCLLAVPNILDAHLPILEVKGNSSFGANEFMHLFWKLFNYEGSGTFDLSRRKLWLLAMLSLFPPTESIYAEPTIKHLDEILDECLQILRQEKTDGSNVMPYDVEFDYEYEEETHEAGQEKRTSLLNNQHEKDVCRTCNLCTILKERMSGLAVATGHEYQDIISTVEPVTLKQLNDAVR